MRKSIHVMLVMMLVSVGFLASISIMSEEAEAAGPPAVTISFHPGEEEQIADVRPGEHGTVTFPGEIEAELPAGGNVQDVIVSLSGSTDMNWPVTINPPVVHVNPGSKSAFSVTVAVPPEMSYYVTATLTVTGQAVAFPGALRYPVQAVTGSIRIQQFYKFALECDKSYREVKPTEQLAFNLRIWNYGNGRDTYSLLIPRLSKLASEGWNVVLTTYNVQIEEKNPGIVQISVQTPVKFHHWINDVTTIEVEVKSEQQGEIAGEAISKIYPLSIRQRGFSLPGFDPMLIIISFAFITIFIGRTHQHRRSRAQRKTRRVRGSTITKRRVRKK